MRNAPVAWIALLSAALAAGCDAAGGGKPLSSVPEPMSLLLPEKVRIHPFTGTRAFAKGGGINGIDVRVEALDHFGDATKAFGSFRFELYEYQARETDPRGKRLDAWSAEVGTAEQTVTHWDNISRTYRFRLAWEKPILIGRKFVLAVVFSSPYGPRLFDQRVFVSGE